jgi:non-specific serine/threonine protein kinase/serine/threonine-protein kinase
MSVADGRTRPSPEEQGATAPLAAPKPSDLPLSVVSVPADLNPPGAGLTGGEIPAVALARIAAAIGQEDSAPPQIGRYRLIEVMGVGGMGEVWRAQQEDPIRRTVAIKLIKLGMDTREVIARFEAERQALALLNHPNVAKVLDAGATDAGRPYFVMEYVAGEPITSFCDRHAYTLQQRLQLFSQACVAVQHAHQKGILHRDLKPGNILVTSECGDAQVKVIDFGIAKALQVGPDEQTLHTLAGEIIGTPEYMSPEQAQSDGQDVDTRSDVYSLGVVLYQLLSGALPFDSGALRALGIAGIQRMLREVDPPRPGARLSGLPADDVASIVRRRQTQIRELKRQLRDELEWIPLKAMRKERSARYATASEFAQDIENYLKRRPLLAGPESRRYRVKKFVRRNKVALSVAAAFVLMLAAATVTYVRGIRAEQAKTLAALADTRQVADFQAHMLSGINVQEMGQTLHDAFVEQAQKDWRQSSLDNREAARRRAELDSLLARGYFTDAAIRSLDENIIQHALETIEKQFADRPVIKAQLLQQLANVLRSFTLLERATPPQIEALTIRQHELGNDHPDTLESMSFMGMLLGAKGKWDQAESYAHEVLDRRRRKLGERDRLTLQAKAFLAETVQRQGLARVAEAERYRFEVMEGCRSALGNRDPDTLDAIFRAGQVLLWQKKLIEAEPLLEEALQQMRDVPENPHRKTLIAAHTLGRLRFFQERLDEAELLTRESYEGLRLLAGDENRDTLFAARSLGSIYRAQGNLHDAETFLQRALDGFRRALPDDHLDTLLAIQEMGIVRYEQKKHADAAAYLNEALDGLRGKYGNDDESTLWTIHYLGLVRQAQGEWKDAEALFREAYQHARTTPSARGDAAIWISDYGPCLVSMSRYTEAEQPLLEAYDRLKRFPAQSQKTRLAVVVSALAEMYDHTARPDDAARWREEGSNLRAATQRAQASAARPSN